jgi:predicted nuclease of predicted toxin-antitoxin system
MTKAELKFLVDVGVGKIVEQWLSQNGYDMEAVRDISATMSDDEILGIAVAEKRLVITMDKDFGELVYNSRLPHSGVLLLRLDEATGEEKVGVIKGVLLQHSNVLASHFCVYQNGRLRIKK